MDSSELKLTPQECEEIKDKGRWLRRVANPFVDFYVIVAIGAAGSPMTTEVTQRREDKQVRDHAKDLYDPGSIRGALRLTKASPQHADSTQNLRRRF
jgi:hypothetical protein